MQKIRVSPIGWKVAFDVCTYSVRQRAKLGSRSYSKVLEKHRVNPFAEMGDVAHLQSFSHSELLQRKTRC